MAKKLFIFFFLLGCLNFSTGQTRKDSLYVFVGEKIGTSGMSPDTNGIIWNAAIKATYKIIENVFGKYPKDTIEFESYDHFGEFPFLGYKYVLLFVSNYNGRLIHEKYQYFDVYRTKNGRWASSYKIDDYNHPYNKTTTIKSEVIDFVNEVSYKVKNKWEAENYYPAPYYKVVDKLAIPVYGNYVKELFELKKNSTLKARGIFN